MTGHDLVLLMRVTGQGRVGVCLHAPVTVCMCIPQNVCLHLCRYSVIEMYVFVTTCLPLLKNISLIMQHIKCSLHQGVLDVYMFVHALNLIAANCNC